MSPSSVNGRYVRPIHSLVLDTAPLLTSPYGQIKAFNATNYYTVPLAKEEVKDETARAALEIWGQELKVRQPLAKSVQEVTAFAKKTGDYGVLSAADIHILALTYELECELNHGDWRLMREPERRGPQPAPRPHASASPDGKDDHDDDDDARSVVTNITTATITPSESASVMFHHNAFGHLKTASSESESSTPSTPLNRKLATVDNDSIINSQVTTSTAKATEPSVPSTVESLISVRSSATKDWSTVSDSESESGRKTPTQSSIQTSLDSLALSDSDDGEGTWITPTNIKKHKIRDMTTTNTFLSSAETKPARRLSLSSATSGAVMKSACMTGDYAMQNVALQMGLNLVNMEGGGVRHVKTWVLRCHGCFTITKNMTLKFCPSCGGDTLMRTSTSTSANGEVKIHLKKNMQWTNRGTKFSLPKPQGMTATPSLSAPPPILRPDQKEYIHANTAQRKREKDLMDPDNLPRFLEGNGGGKEGFGFGGRSAGRVGGGRGRGSNAVRRR